MTFNYVSGQLDAAMRIVDEEGYADTSNDARLAAAVELLKVSALLDITSRLRHLEQTLHELNEDR